MEYQEPSPKISVYTTDSISETKRHGPSPYLETIKSNIQYYFPLLTITLIEQEYSDSQENDIDLEKYSIIISNPKLYREKFELWTQAYLDQQKQIFYIRHFVLLNNKELKINFKESESTFFNRLCNKIGIKLHPSKLVVHPISGRIYFQTRAIMSASFLQRLKKNVLKQDCPYTEVIANSLKKADRNIDLILYLTGKIDISELLKSKTVANNYQFLVECNKILNELDHTLFYIEFLDLNKSQKELSNDIITMLSLSDTKLHQRQQIKKKQEQQVFCDMKSSIIQNSLQYFSPEIQNILKIYKSDSINLYQNSNFRFNPFNFKESIQFSTCKFYPQSYDRQKQSTLRHKRILTYIKLVNASEEEDQEEDSEYYTPIQTYNWEVIAAGGFGLLECATILYRDLSSSYCEIESGFDVILKRAMVRKTDRVVNKISREKKVLQTIKNESHPNLMNFFVSFQEQHQNCLFSEFFPNLSLDLFLKKNQMTLGFDKKVSLILQIVSSLQFLHQKGIIHLDIKPGNFIVTKNVRLLLSDFGQALIKSQDNPQTHKHAFTVPYCAPEIFLDKAMIGEKTDAYAVAVCIFKIIFPEENIFEVFFKRKFLVRLRNNEIFNVAIGEKFEGFFLAKIYKIIMFVVLKVINHEISHRLGLNWISQIFKRIKHFFHCFLYND